MVDDDRIWALEAPEVAVPLQRNRTRSVAIIQHRETSARTHLDERRQVRDVGQRIEIRRRRLHELPHLGVDPQESVIRVISRFGDAIEESSYAGGELKR